MSFASGLASVQSSPGPTPSPRRASSIQALGWTIGMLAAVALASFIVRHLIAHAHAYVDPASRVDLSVLLNMPVPVANKIDNGWAVVGVVWALVLALVWCGRRCALALRERRQPWLLGAFALVAIALCFFPALLSGDVYAYVMYGRLYGLHHINPYFLPLPLQPRFDPVIARCLTIYGNPPPGDSYGPLWTMLAGVLSKLLADASLAAQVIAQRFLAVAFAFIAILGLQRLLAKACAAPTGLARFALHPLLLFEAAVGAHNDPIMLAAAIWAFAVVEELPLLAGLLMGAAIAVKYVAIFALPFLLVQARRRGWGSALLCGLIALGVLVLLFEPFWIGRLTTLSLLWQSRVVSMSPTWLVTLLAAAVSHPRAFGYIDWTAYNRPVQIAFAFVFAGLYGVMLWRAAGHPMRRIGWGLWPATAALLWLAPMLNPWYCLWLLPAAAYEGAVARYAWWLGLCAFLRYAGEVPIYPPLGVLIAVTLLIFGLPLLLAHSHEPKALEITGQTVPG